MRDSTRRQAPDNLGRYFTQETLCVANGCDKRGKIAQALDALHAHTEEHCCQPARRRPRPCNVRVRLQRTYNQLSDYGLLR
jgi:hypothetical protein